MGAVLRVSDEFIESEHPRAADGKFGSGGGASKAPLKFGELKKVGPQLGSNTGGVFANSEGEKFYLKKGATPRHVANEMAAAALYKLAGVNTLSYREVEGGKSVATEMRKLDKKSVKKFSPEEIEKAREDFVVHAWLANWDAVGLEADNLGMVDGKVTALDLGGALEYRAQGGEKGRDFGETVNELTSMRAKSKNYQSARLFGPMTGSDLQASAKKVTSIPDEAIRKAVPDRALADKLIARKKDIARQLGITFADEEFDESLHPRDPEGKFTAGSGTSANVKVANALKSVLKAGGYKKKKLENAQGLPVYFHPSGAEITIHPSKFKSGAPKALAFNWESTKAGKQVVSGYHGQALAKLLRVAAAKAMEKSELKPFGSMPGAGGANDPKLSSGYNVPKKTGTENMSSEDIAAFTNVQGHLDKIGFQFIPHDLSNTKDVKWFSSPFGPLQFELSTGAWKLTNSGKEGVGLFELKEKLGIKPQTEEMSPTKFTPQASSSIGLSLKAKGYNHEKSFNEGTEPVSIFAKENGAKVQYNHDTKDWLVQTPGFQTKEGNGAVTLEALLAGEKFGGANKWENTHKSIGPKPPAPPAPPPPKPKPESALMTKLMSLAPVPDHSEKQAISSYSGNGYSEINGQLRHSPKSTSNEPKVKALDAYLSKTTIPETMTLYRKVSGEYAKILKSIMAEGCAFVDRGFISTSTHEGTWSGDLKMKITVPAGAKGAAIKAFSQHQSENEVLLPRNTRLLVNSIDYESGVVDVTVDLEFGHQKAAA